MGLPATIIKSFKLGICAPQVSMFVSQATPSRLAGKEALQGRLVLPQCNIETGTTAAADLQSISHRPLPPSRTRECRICCRYIRLLDFSVASLLALYFLTLVSVIPWFLSSPEIRRARPVGHYAKSDQEYRVIEHLEDLVLVDLKLGSSVDPILEDSPSTARIFHKCANKR